MSNGIDQPSGEITTALINWASGDASAADRLLPLVYDELRTLAANKLRHERPDLTLQATALVHEVFVRLFGKGARTSLNNRSQFFRLAATAMRQILIDSARAKKTAKRSGSGRLPRCGTFLGEAWQVDLDLLLDLDQLLTQLEAEDPGVAELVKLRLYAGLSTSEAAEVLGVSRSKAYDDWLFARFWFADRMAR